MPGLRRRHQGRRDRASRCRATRRTRRSQERAASLAWTFEPSGHPVEFLSLSGKLGRPGPGDGPLASGRCSSARSSTSTRPRPRSSPSSSSTATTTTCRCSTSRTSRRRSSSWRRTRASRSSRTTAGCRRPRSACSCARSSSSSRRAPTRSSASPSSRSPTCSGRRPTARASSASSSCRDVMDQPRLFSTFMLWMLAQLYETLPEVGDLPKPKLCFFFDEAHLLFDDASDALMDQIERTARLIRSKGVGVYFVTQAPTDVPSSVLAQLGNRVQHALRAFTPDDADALRKTARTFPMTTHYDVEKTITSLGTGEALVTVLSPRGVPTPLAATRLLPPDSLMAALPPADLQARIAASLARHEVRDRRSTARAPTRSSPAGSPRPGRPPPRRPRTQAMRGRRATDDGRRAQHDDAGPAAARDPAPGARDGRGPEGRRARAQGRGPPAGGARAGADAAEAAPDAPGRTRRSGPAARS